MKKRGIELWVYDGGGMWIYILLLRTTCQAEIRSGQSYYYYQREWPPMSTARRTKTKTKQRFCILSIKDIGNFDLTAATKISGNTAACKVSDCIHGLMANDMKQL